MTGRLFRNYDGRFWASDAEGHSKDLSPGPDYLRLHVNGRWVQLEELPENWMGALVMTSTESPLSHTLQAVRYCAP
ncbi:hypothetical protein D7W79_36505 [Corallococcus exercitus]|uniref:Uncharacterized protein n=1 Tax=Corallococcus exercitus TaxID=2316736 RepID=A0A3A8H6R7_9BACT|nr:hypothetical protein [Corallococcus exercitus]NOK36937.1 hypothetical protein [Corallococcus exercitus]RKG66495.1 hypothetical protein D7W79_36505 [Corallococcus exercitus]